ncbi:MAG: hypothetical protein JWR61_1860 [Ferruginibacter sp.]|uniref:hypothetical protein n=1 Tax=Ferruginibacter sp. TaxID=1940288 RepID=UPI002658283B|nr:hypothetical protein [Ferruginibacter sp.]MDB5276905.1 hypothetical protein [Ferruginibacter sp.]
MFYYTKLNGGISVAFVTIILLTACQNYYKASQVHLAAPTNRSTVIDSLKQSERYFILRSGNDAFYMKNPMLNADQKTMACILDSVPFYHQLLLINGTNKNKKYKKGDPLNSMVLNEAHFYISQDNGAALGTYTLQLDSIQKIEVIEKDKKRTTGSYVLGRVILTVGIVGIVAIIAGAASTNWVSGVWGPF